MMNEHLQQVVFVLVGGVLGFIGKELWYSFKPSKYMRTSDCERFRAECSKIIAAKVIIEEIKRIKLGIYFIADSSSVPKDKLFELRKIMEVGERFE